MIKLKCAPIFRDENKGYTWHCWIIILWTLTNRTLQIELHIYIFSHIQYITCVVYHRIELICCYLKRTWFLLASELLHRLHCNFQLQTRFPIYHFFRVYSTIGHTMWHSFVHERYKTFINRSILALCNKIGFFQFHIMLEYKYIVHICFVFYSMFAWSKCSWPFACFATCSL